MLINSDGVIIRIRANEVSTSGRSTQGVKIMRVGEDSRIVSFAKVVDEENQGRPDSAEEELEEIAEDEAVEAVEEVEDISEEPEA